MRFVCDKGHQFIHPAKQVLPTRREDDKLGPTLAIGLTPLFAVSSYIETSVCPECQSIHYTEVAQPEPKITNVVTMSIEDDPVTQAYLQAKIQEGYVVESLYAKTATLVKREAKTA
jgi:hypothetical protein